VRDPYAARAARMCGQVGWRRAHDLGVDPGRIHCAVAGGRRARSPALQGPCHRALHGRWVRLQAPGWEVLPHRVAAGETDGAAGQVGADTGGDVPCHGEPAAEYDVGQGGSAEGRNADGARVPGDRCQRCLPGGRGVGAGGEEIAREALLSQMLAALTGAASAGASTEADPSYLAKMSSSIGIQVFVPCVAIGRSLEIFGTIDQMADMGIRFIALSASTAIFRASSVKYVTGQVKVLPEPPS